MRQSQLFSKTFREAPRDEESVNAKLLIRGGFVDKTMAGVYTFLSLGLRVLNKIENIVREEMNRARGNEIFMPALHAKELWQTTGRWESFDALFKIKTKTGAEYALGPTHEEVLYSLLTRFISSYRDLPLAVYQIQTKFRDEPRAKSGLLRCREFRMKDLYSFHTNDIDRDAYYETMRKAYHTICKRLGLNAIETDASGGSFSEKSHEFQVISSAGEDSIFVCEKCHVAVNREIAKKGVCAKCGGATKEEHAIEIGNIFPLKEKFAKDFNLIFKDEKGVERLVSAGCYGFGTSRALGTIVETYHDEKGIIWPKEVSPYEAHLLVISKDRKISDEIYASLQKLGKEILYDDREGKTAGEKFSDADLVGIPVRIVVSDKTLEKDSVEVKMRDSKESKLVAIKDLEKEL